MLFFRCVFSHFFHVYWPNYSYILSVGLCSDLLIYFRSFLFLLQHAAGPSIEGDLHFEDERDELRTEDAPASPPAAADTPMLPAAPHVVAVTGAEAASRRAAAASQRVAAHAKVEQIASVFGDRCACVMAPGGLCGALVGFLEDMV